MSLPVTDNQFSGQETVKTQLVTYGDVAAGGDVWAEGEIRSDGAFTSSSPSAGIGYSVGAGSSVAQGSSRTTAVEIDAMCGKITLVSAAGSTTAASFTVTNSSVHVTDGVMVWQVSGTDKYDLSVTAVADGSFQITSRTYAGTSTESPVFGFMILKGVIT